MNAREIAAAVHSGADPGTWARAAVKIIANNPYNAFRPFDVESVARDIAVSHRAGRLAGVPIAIKDNLADAGQPCGCGSRALNGYRAPYSAHCLDLLRAAGAIIVARTNMDEFAMGSSTENSAFGPVDNPLSSALSPGGSSGGSAAAVAAGIVPIALGTDTGGSVRQPAAFCGIVGIKPTYGRISRRGLVAFASSLDTVAPFAANVRDAALVCEVLCGYDAGDATSLDRAAEDWVGACDQGVRSLRIGVLDECAGAEASPGVILQIERAVALLSAQGARVTRISVPAVTQSLAAYYVIASAEAASNLARFDGVRFGRRAGSESAGRESATTDRATNVRNDSPSRGTGRATTDRAAMYVHSRSEGFGSEVQRRILLGTHVLSAGAATGLHGRALLARAQLSAAFDAAFQHVDILLSPTTPTVAFPLGENTNKPLAMYLADRFTIPASLAGLPAISVPFGTADGLPVGIQLTANRYDEARLFATAAALEANA